MINSKLTRPATQQVSTEERLFKVLESIDWKLWEMMNMMKAQAGDAPTATKTTSKVTKATAKKTEDAE